MKQGIPIRSELSFDAPVANIQLPNWVLFKIKYPMATNINHHKIDIGKSTFKIVMLLLKSVDITLNPLDSLIPPI